MRSYTLTYLSLLFLTLGTMTEGGLAYAQPTPAPAADIPVTPANTTEPVAAQSTAAPAPSTADQPIAAAQQTVAPLAALAEEQAKALIKESLQAVNSSEPTDTPTPEGYAPSYGTWHISLFFSPKNAERLKKVIETGEKYLLMGGDAAVAQNNEDEEIAKLLAEEEAKTQKEPVKISYPTFLLHSIMYRSANDWSVWLNKNLLTNDKRSIDAGVRVEEISPESVKFSWSPPKEFVDAVRLANLQQKQKEIAQRKKPAENGTKEATPAEGQTQATTSENKPAPAPAESAQLAPSRIAIDTKAGYYDKTSNIIYFTLRPNQIFSTQDYQVYEGVPSNLSQINPEETVTKIETKENTETSDKEDASSAFVKSRRSRGAQAEPPAAAPAGVDSVLTNEAEKKLSPRARFSQAIDD